MGTSHIRSDANDAQNNYENYRFCYENGHHEWLERASRNFDYFRGKQWHPSDIAKRKAAGKPHLTLNVIESLVRAMKGVQRALRSDVRFQPVSDADAQLAEVHDALWMDVQNRNDLDFIETDIWEKGLITGRAYYETRLELDENMRGELKIKARRSQDVILDPAIDNYHPRTWPQVFTTSWVSRLDIEHAYGRAAVDQLAYSDMPQWYQYEDRMMAQRLGQLPYYYYIGMPDRSLMRAFRLLERQYQDLVYKEVFVDLKTGDYLRIPDGWDRNKVSQILDMYDGEIGTMRRKVKTIKWRVTCENLVLHDSESPYKDYTVVPFFPTFIDGETMGIVDSLIDPQNLYNKMTSEELAIITTTAHSGYKIKRGSLKNMTIEELERKGSQTGFVAELDDIANLEKIQPSALSAGHDRLSFKADQVMRQLAGVPNQIRGFAREDVAGEAIELNTAGADLNFAAFLSNLHRTKKMLAENCQAIWQENYDETRVVMINRGSTYKPQFDEVHLNKMSPEGQVVNDITKGRYTTMLVPSPARSTLSGEELAQLIEMRKELGIKIPDDVFIEHSNIPHKAQLLARMKEDSNEVARQQEQRDQEQHANEQRLTDAKVEKEQSSASLNKARADKAQAEAGKDPDAAYVTVEQDRIAADQRQADAKLKLEWHKEERETREGLREHAREVTKMHLDAKAKEKQGLASRSKSKKD